MTMMLSAFTTVRRLWATTTAVRPAITALRAAWTSASFSASRLLVASSRQVTAIVGPSGAGKTTLLSLLERLYTPNEGQIKFGDTPVEKIHLDQWRGAMGYIQQASPLLSGTIRDNIVYGLNRPAKDEEVVKAAKTANAYDFIMELPDGFDTDIGQLGGKLSGGCTAAPAGSAAWSCPRRWDPRSRSPCPWG